MYEHRVENQTLEIMNGTTRVVYRVLFATDQLKLKGSCGGWGGEGEGRQSILLFGPLLARWVVGAQAG
jgi:hypothetical protein